VDCSNPGSGTKAVFGITGVVTSGSVTSYHIVTFGVSKSTHLYVDVL